MMSKKDFVGLADALRPSYSAGALRIKDAEAVADFLASNNPQFLRDRWLGYLRGENGPISKGGNNMTKTKTTHMPELLEAAKEALRQLNAEDCPSIPDGAMVRGRLFSAISKAEGGK